MVIYNQASVSGKLRRAVRTDSLDLPGGCLYGRAYDTEQHTGMLRVRSQGVRTIPATGINVLTKPPHLQKADSHHHKQAFISKQKALDMKITEYQYAWSPRDAPLAAQLFRAEPHFK